MSKQHQLSARVEDSLSSFLTYPQNFLQDQGAVFYAPTHKKIAECIQLKKLALAFLNIARGSKSSKPLTREQELLEELEYLRAENALLKKLQALDQVDKKQKPSSS